MAYTKVGWEDLPSTNTPLNVTNLDHMDDGIAAALTDENVKNLQTTSASDTYSCNYINNEFNNFLTITTESITLGTINAQAGKYDQTSAITIPTGYTPVGIMGYSISGGSSASINLSRLFIDNGNITYSAYNSATSGSSASTTALYVNILFIKL